MLKVNGIRTSKLQFRVILKILVINDCDENLHGYGKTGRVPDHRTLTPHTRVSPKEKKVRGQQNGEAVGSAMNKKSGED